MTLNFRYNKFKNTNIGAIPTLSKALRGMNYGHQIINDAFNKFVPKNEYSISDKEAILEDLYKRNRDGFINELPS